MKETRWINLEDLDEIIGVYGIRKDIRARAAIENQAVSGPDIPLDSCGGRYTGKRQ